MARAFLTAAIPVFFATWWIGTAIQAITH